MDIVFIDTIGDDDRITKIYHSCPPCLPNVYCEGYKGEGRFVLEIMGGTCKRHGIQEGDIVSFTDIDPSSSVPSNSDKTTESNTDYMIPFAICSFAFVAILYRIYTIESP